jgi:hypothetical protein
MKLKKYKVKTNNYYSYLTKKIKCLLLFNANKSTGQFNHHQLKNHLKSERILSWNRK